ncbi:MAG: hypothetical protein ACUVYA_10935 [Planctomycetota bacterium]
MGHGAGAISVSYQRPDGSFAAAPSVPNPRSFQGLATGKFDRDGHLRLRDCKLRSSRRDGIPRHRRWTGDSQSRDTDRRIGMLPRCRRLRCRRRR